jgi:hypothetical protein
MRAPQRDELENLDTPGQGKRDKIKVFNALCIANCLVSEMMAGKGSAGMWG